MTTDQDSTQPDEPGDDLPTLGEDGANEDAETEADNETESLLGEGDEDTEGEDGDGEPSGEVAEIEIDGKRYTVPAELKGAFLRQDDYTRKTQSVAEARRTIEEAQQAIMAEAKALEEESEERGKLAMINSRLAAYEKYTDADWRNYELQNPVDAQAHWRQFSMLKEQRGQIVSSLEGKSRERSENAQREHATRVANALAELNRDIRGWGPQVAAAVTQYGENLGYTRDELSGIADSRAIKALYKAMQYDQLMAKQKGAPRVQSNPSAVVKPLKQVSKGAARPTATQAPSDRDSDEVWFKKRNAQIRKRSA